MLAQFINFNYQAPKVSLTENLRLMHKEPRLATDLLPTLKGRVLSFVLSKVGLAVLKAKLLNINGSKAHSNQAIFRKRLY